MSSKPDDSVGSTTRMAITEDTKFRTNVKTIIAIMSATAVGTIFFATVMYKLDTLDQKLDSYEQMVKMKINYLFHQTNTYNPFEGGQDAPSPVLRNPLPIPTVP